MKHPLTRRLHVLALVALPTMSTACGGHDAAEESATSESDLSVTAKEAASGTFAGAFASPTIFRTGGTDHAYFAKQTITLGDRAVTFHVPHATFAHGTWSSPNEALPRLGRGAKQDGPVWAPAAAQISGDHYMLYYTAQVAPTAASPNTEKKCIWRAHASSPHGPFIDDFDGPLVCQGETLWTIDPYVVKDAQGDWTLAARVDLGDGINSIQVRKLGPWGEHFADGSEWHLLARNEQGSWDQHVMENAGLVRLAPPGGGAPHWFVFYSARAWDDDTYAIGYADCGENIFGLAGDGCKKETSRRPWMATDQAAGLYGPGTPTFYTDEQGRKLMSIQAWRYEGGVAPGSPNRAKNRAQGQIMRSYAIDVDAQYRPHVRLERIDL